jgi:flagellar basal-body rod modification protein FlgD
MNVSAVGAAGAASSNTATSVGGAQAVDYQAFLKLLVAQMKNQDPTAPMESTDYVAQLATFSQVEQSVQMNNKLEAMIVSSSIGQAAGLIGREIETMDSKAKGIVKSVELYADGSVLVLENGTKIPMTASFTVREPQAVAPAPVPTPPDNDTAGTPADSDEDAA